MQILYFLPDHLWWGEFLLVNGKGTDNWVFLHLSQQLSSFTN